MFVFLMHDYLCSVGLGLLYIYGRPIEQGRPLYFCPVISIFYLFFRRLISALDVYHTSTHGVALVQI